MFDCQQRQTMSTSSPFEAHLGGVWRKIASIPGPKRPVDSWDSIMVFTMICSWKVTGEIRYIFFPHLPGGVVRFYHSCSGSSSFFSSSSSFYFITAVPAPPPSSPPRRPSPPPPLPSHFLVHFCLANSSLFANFRACWTSTAGFRSEWARLDLNRKVLSAVGTAGPQPGTFRAQWAPLGLNLGPSELSGHRWTSAARWNARIYARKTARIYAR